MTHGTKMEAVCRDTEIQRLIRQAFHAAERSWRQPGQAAGGG